MTDELPAVRLQRRIPAPPHEVYRAWLEPELMRRWLAPASFTVTRVEVDERVGGRMGVWQAGDDGVAMGGFESEFVELVPDERIVLIWRFVGPERIVDPALDSRLTITFAEATGGATELTLVHERLDAIDEALPGMAGHAKVGWGQALDQLSAMLEEVSR
jgi:uncharacterized protein YndB with AHSA1/START domain